MALREFSSVKVGDALPEKVIPLTRGDLVNYAGVSGDANPIHWDESIAKLAGLPDVIAHGMWTMGAAAELVADWVGDPAAVVDVRTKFTAPVVVPWEGSAQIEVRGSVKKVTPGEGGAPASALVDLAVTCGGEKVLTRAQALVQLAGDER